MKGYVYLDNDGNLNIRTQYFIEEQDPTFWARNAHIVDTVWTFDSENPETMLKLMQSFKRLELVAQRVKDFCSQIGFDLATFIRDNSVSKPTFSVPNDNSVQ